MGLQVDHQPPRLTGHSATEIRRASSPIDESDAARRSSIGTRPTAALHHASAGRKAGDATAEAPTIAVRTTHALTPRWSHHTGLSAFVLALRAITQQGGVASPKRAGASLEDPPIKEIAMNIVFTVLAAFTLGWFIRQRATAAAIHLAADALVFTFQTLQLLLGYLAGEHSEVSTTDGTFGPCSTGSRSRTTTRTSSPTASSTR